jgi:hypothetical protein
LAGLGQPETLDELVGALDLELEAGLPAGAALHFLGFALDRVAGDVAHRLEDEAFDHELAQHERLAGGVVAPHRELAVVVTLGALLLGHADRSVS